MDSTSLPFASPYQAISVFHSAAPLSTLTDAFALIRGNYEIVDVYVKPPGDKASFEPLEAYHFGLECEWVTIARRRHPSNEPRIVGIMLAKDEADIIPDVITSLSTTLDALYYFAGDDATAKAIKDTSPVGWARDIPNPQLPHTDGLRQFLLERARVDAFNDDDPRPMWIIVVQGDEIYHDDLKQHIMLAQVERATVMTCQVATFLLHESQREGWDWSLPLSQRLTHYIWDFGEHTGFLNFPWIFYIPEEHMRAHPHGLYPAKWATARPVRKHYPFRSPTQAAARIADRLKMDEMHPHGWQPHYQHYRDIFFREGDDAARREVKRFFGWFPEAERVEGIF